MHPLFGALLVHSQHAHDRHRGPRSPSSLHPAPQAPAPRAPAGRLASPGEYLTFRLGGEEYGIALGAIQEILGYQQPTRSVGAPDDICGVLNLRGAIVAIIDLRLRFALEPRIDASTVIVVVNVRGSTVGLVVDAVADRTSSLQQSSNRKPS